MDGPGLRLTVFTQGCPHRCPGCHNPHTHDAQGGRIEDTDQIAQRLQNNPLLAGLTLSGGEPFEQAAACAVLAQSARRGGLNVWAYSGYTLEQLQARKDADTDRLLEAIDVLVDGPFIQSQRSLELDYCGSRNQRLIDMAQTRAQGRPVLWQPPEW